MRVSSESVRVLRCAGEQTDDGLDLAETALALAAMDKPESDLAPYRDHLQSLVDSVRQQGSAVKLDDRLCFLRRSIVVQHKYKGDDDACEDLRDMDLMQVIDRRQGSAVALGIVFLHVAEKLGWPMVGLNFPGRFLVRLSGTDGRAILDPFRSGETCGPETLRSLIPADEAGALDRLSDCYAPLSKRDVLLRLLNTVKRRQLGLDQVDAATVTMQSMILIAPKRQELWRELGCMQAERGNLCSAVSALEIVAGMTKEPEESERVAVLLDLLRRQLN